MVAILMALPEESQGLIEQAVAHNPNVRVFFSGMGLLAASHRTTEIILQYRPEKIINLGTAGSRHLALGRLVEVHCVKNRSIHLSPALDEWIKIPTVTNLLLATCGSADYVDDSTHADRFDVLDMEAYAIAYVCKRMNMPLTIVKYVSDNSLDQSKEVWRKQLFAAAQQLSQTLASLLS